LGRLTRASSGFPHHAGEALGRCSCLLVGDIGQLSSVMDFPLYCSVPKSAIADCGRTTCQLLGKAVVLTEVLGQDGQDSERVRFQELLLRREPIYHLHSGPNISKASSEDASGLQPVTCLACGARSWSPLTYGQKLAL